MSLVCGVPDMWCAWYVVCLVCGVPVCGVQDLMDKLWDICEKEESGQ